MPGIHHALPFSWSIPSGIAMEALMLVGLTSMPSPLFKQRPCFPTQNSRFRVHAADVSTRDLAQYQPPACAFDRVVLQLDVVSEGRQFDRLAIMYLGDIEVWRTSTAEPKPSPGIVWTVRKDMTAYLSLWREPQTLIFDLGNLVNDKYTGAFNATLTATFFESHVLGSNGASADAILPISAGKGAEGKASAFTYPQIPAETVLVLPKNVNRAVLTVAATGQAGEEFWWSNVPEQDKNVFDLEAGPLPGLSSFREVQVRIDDNLVGIAWPFPVVFTGGVAPPLHRPVVDLQAFDLREDEIDISPFLGLLCDGLEHKVSIDVFGVNDTDGQSVLAQVPMHWVLSGKLFLWLDGEDSVTTGSMPRVDLPTLSYATERNASDDIVVIKQSVRRRFNAEAEITTQRGTQVRRWQKSGKMNTFDELSDNSDTQYVESVYTQMAVSHENDSVVSVTDAAYYINSNTIYREPDGDYDFSLNATLHSAMDLALEGLHVSPNGLEPFLDELEGPQNRTSLRTWKHGNGFFASLDGGNSSEAFGNTEQNYKLEASEKVYNRAVRVFNETTKSDLEFVLGRLPNKGARVEPTAASPMQAAADTAMQEYLLARVSKWAGIDRNSRLKAGIHRIRQPGLRRSVRLPRQHSEPLVRSDGNESDVCEETKHGGNSKIEEQDGP